MNQEKLQRVYEDFGNALSRLQEAVKAASGDVIVRDATIQRFEFTFELAWKLMKRILQANGVDISAPRLVIKEAFKNQMIEDGQAWLTMLDDRNRTVHVYDEKEIEEIYSRICGTYVVLLGKYQASAKKFLNR